MKKRVMIGYAEYEFNHKSVAQYVKNYFVDKDDYEIMIINLDDYLNKKTISNLTNNFFYNLFNNKMTNKQNINLCVKLYDNENLRKVISDFNPDIVIATHFYMSYISLYYNSLKLINSKIMSIIVSSKHLDWWLIDKSNIDAFIVKNEIVKTELVKYKVDENKIYPFGIPINRCLSEDILSKDLILKRYSLDSSKPIYLFFCSEDSRRDYIFEYFKGIVSKNYPIQIILMTDKNKELRLKCENLILKNDLKNVLVLGFSKDIYNLLNICDVVITKPNSETLYKCLEMKKPCILIPGISSQEINNSKYMTKNHYAVKIRGVHSLSRRIKLFLNYPFLVSSMRNKLLKLNDEEALKNIYSLTDKILGNKKK